MRHGKKVNHLGRKAGHRKALMTNMAAALVREKRIQTTLAKAKSLRKYVEPLVTRSKENTTHNRRMAFKYLQDKKAVDSLFDEIGPKVADRPGGYTRIIRIGNRLGDNAEMCIMEFVDFNETYVTEKKEKSRSKKRRTRRGGSGKESGQEPAAAPQAGPAVEKTVSEPADVVEEIAEVAEEAVETTVAETTEEVTASAEEAVAAVDDAVEEVSADAGSDEEGEEKEDQSEEDKEEDKA